MPQGPFQHKPEPPDPDPTPVADDDQVRAYKHRQLLRLGFAHPDADELAALGIDLHELVALIDRGCEPYTAARIVRP